MKTQFLTKARTQMDTQLHKDRLRALLLFPEMRSFLTNGEIEDIKSHTYKKIQDNKLVRHRVQMSHEGKTVNLTQFQYVNAEGVKFETWNVNGSISRFDTEFKGESFVEHFGVSALGEEFVQKFLSALPIEEVSKELKLATKNMK